MFAPRTSVISCSCSYRKSEWPLNDDDWVVRTFFSYFSRCLFRTIPWIRYPFVRCAHTFFIFSHAKRRYDSSRSRAKCDFRIKHFYSDKYCVHYTFSFLSQLLLYITIKSFPESASSFILFLFTELMAHRHRLSIIHLLESNLYSYSYINYINNILYTWKVL